MMVILLVYYAGMLMKEILDAYVLWQFDKNLIS